MSNRLTPETDALRDLYENYEYRATVGDIWELCEALERERDEAREAVAKWESSFAAMERAGAEQARRADENCEWALRAEQERDEAREALIPFISLNPNSQRVKEKWDGFVQAAKKALEGEE